MAAERTDELPWTSLVLAFLAIGLVASFATAAAQRMEGRSLQFGRQLLLTVPSWLFWGLAARPVFGLVRAVPFAPGNWRQPLAIHGAVGLVLVLLQTGLTVGLARTIFRPSRSETPWQTWFLGYLGNAGLANLLIVGGLVALSHAILTRKRLHAQELAGAELAADLARSELAALHLQLQPHFLFNTLHAIGVLNREDPARATRMIASLGDLLRGSLATRASPEVTLATELTFLRDYLEIEQTRFADRLEVAVEVAPSLGTSLVPPFLLQPLVENAIRHGVARRVGLGSVRVRGRREGGNLVLSIWNDGQLDGAPAGDGLGLTTTRDRLSRLYGAGAWLELRASDGGVETEVVLPWHEQHVL